MIELDETVNHPNASIKVIGVGGAGCNTVNSIVAAGCNGIECIVANTDAQALSLSKAHQVIHIGVKSTKGLGTGANPELGKRAAEEDLDKIMEAVGDADIVFLTAGMGGGTGSGSLPVVAQALRERGILTIAVVTKPFVFEGKRRAAVAEKALEAVRKEVDTLIVIPNQKLLDVVDAQVSMIDAFAMINEILGKSVKGISDIITKPGHINVDFADVRTIMKDMGLAVMGTGTASGKNRASQATMHAISSPLLENMSIKGARGVLLNISGGKNLSLHEISEAANVIYEQAHEDAMIILGSVIDEAMNEQVTVTIIATGFVVCAAITDHAENFATSKSIVASESAKVIASVMAVEEKVEQVHVKGTLDVQKAHQTKCQKSDEIVEKHVDEVSYVSQSTENKNSAQVEQLASPDADAAMDMNDLDTPAYMRKNKEHEKN